MATNYCGHVRWCLQLFAGRDIPEFEGTLRRLNNAVTSRGRLVDDQILAVGQVDPASGSSGTRGQVFNTREGSVCTD
jgi:hypothetical protein